MQSKAARKKGVSNRVLVALAHLRHLEGDEEYDANDHMRRFDLSRATSRRDFNILLRAISEGIVPGLRVRNRSYGRVVIQRRQNDSGQ